MADAIQSGFIYLKSKQPGKEVGPQIANDNVESNASSQHQPDHAAKTTKYTRVRRQGQEPCAAAPAPGQLCASSHTPRIRPPQPSREDEAWLMLRLPQRQLETLPGTAVTAAAAMGPPHPDEV